MAYKLIYYPRDSRSIERDEGMGAIVVFKRLTHLAFPDLLPEVPEYVEVEFEDERVAAAVRLCNKPIRINWE